MLHADWASVSASLSRREFTLVWTGTANHARSDSEHPWPGYITLLDVLYTRRAGALHKHDRDHNLVYVLPVPVDTLLARVNRRNPPTATYIVDEFSDLLVLEGGVVPGRPIRGAATAPALLTW